MKQNYTELNQLYSPTSSLEAKGRIRFKMVPTESIFPNPQGNPRQNIKQRDIDKLCESIIACKGILVPLVVVKGSKEKQFYLLDGERRLIAAKKLGLQKVPVNILPKALADDEHLATMFTIHMARVPWNTMARAMALNQFLALRPGLEKDKKELRQITGMSSYEIENAMLVRMFPKEIQMRGVYAEKPDGLNPSYLIELAKVIKKAEDLGILAKADRPRAIDSVVKKIGHVISDPYQIKDFGKLLGNVQKKEASRMFERLVEEQDCGIMPLLQEYSDRVKVMRSLHVSSTDSSIQDFISFTKTQWGGLLTSLTKLKDVKLSPHELEDLKRLLNETESALTQLG